MAALFLPAAATASALSEPAVPAMFAPGVISGTGSNMAPTFSPDGRTVWFTRADGAQVTIMVSHLDRGQWSQPETAAFSGKWRDMEPALSPDGRYMIFASNRPVDGGDAPVDGFFMGKSFPGKGGNLWRVDRKGEGWGEPVRLPASINTNGSLFSPSVAADGSLYFMRPAADPKLFQLFRAKPVDGGYGTPEPLSFSDGTSSDFDPAVAPDQRFIIFSSRRAPAQKAELFIAFRRGDGWSAPLDLGDKVNDTGVNIEAKLGSDHRTLYYSCNRVVPGVTADWNNGKLNIWHVSLIPWLKRERRKELPPVHSAG